MKGTKMKNLLLLLAIVLGSVGCSRQAQVASNNLSVAADQFELHRRIVFYNGITGDYMLVIEGRCSIQKDGRDNQLEVTCKEGPRRFRKHFLGISDNVTYFVEHLRPTNVSASRYRVIFRPSTIVPEFEVD